MNQCVLVGRLSSIQNDYVVLTVTRTFKNSEDIYDIDNINVYLSGNIRDRVHEYCHKGDVIGIRGRITSAEYSKEGVTYRQLKIIAEKVTFLSSNPNVTKAATEVEEYDFDGRE